MPCPHFVDGPRCRCSAVRGVLVPSHYERERFCRTESAALCPTYGAHQRLGAVPLPQEVYYALWTIPPPRDAEDAACTDFTP